MNVPHFFKSLALMMTEARVKTPPDLVMILWIDAETDGGWKAVNDVEKAPLAFTIGFVVYEDSRIVTVASTLSKKESNARITIPGQWIVRRWKVPFKVR